MRFCSSRRQHAAVALHSIISIIISIWLLVRGQLDDSFVTARNVRPLRHQRISQAACTGQGEGTPWRPGPAKVRSLAGQKARQLLVENPVLFEARIRILCAVA
ncbi:PDIL2-1 [Symbiodinium sp. CCMP2456]|nr:PDIL2-1 [Symbiodinium sp. CCMP2456]